MFGSKPTISTSKASTASPWKTVFPTPFIPERSSENGIVAGAAEASVAQATATAAATTCLIARGSLIVIRRATQPEEYHDGRQRPARLPTDVRRPRSDRRG